MKSTQPDLFSREELPFNLMQDDGTFFDWELEMERRRLEALAEKRQLNIPMPEDGDEG